MPPCTRGLLVLVLLLCSCGPDGADGIVDGGPVDHGPGDATTDTVSDTATPDGLVDIGLLEHPFVVSSAPLLDEEDVYPASIVDGTGEAVSLRVDVSSAMDVTRHEAVLSSSTGNHVLSGEWDSAAMTITFVVSAPPFSGAPPLVDETDYELDLSGLRSVTGAPLEPEIGLRASRLEFRTGVRDPLLNHSCGHVAFGPYADALASVAPSPGADRVDLPHHLYTLELPVIPSGETYGGYVRFRAAAAGTFHFFLDGAIAVARVDDVGASTPLDVRATPAACDGITHQVTFEGLGDETYMVQFGPSAEPVIHVIVEAEYASD